MSAAWRAFDDEVGRWRDSGRAVELWWRDDDAARPTPALERLCLLAARCRVPLALAAVPSAAEPAALAGAGVSVLQHGTDHINRGAPGGKKTEFPEGEDPAAAIARLVAARARLAAIAGGRFLPVLAPPWNRVPAHLVPKLPGAGYRGLTRFGARAADRAVSGFPEVNTHVDIIAWRAGRGFAGEAEVLGSAVRHLGAKRTGAADAAEPTGWLTHHACHDEPAWAFLERLFEHTGSGSGVAWRRAEEIFHA